MFIFLVLATQQLTSPILAAGSSANFSSAVVRVEEKLAAGDWQGASLAAKLLPRKAILVQWDDHNVPAQDREQLAIAREAGFRNWANKIVGITAKVVTDQRPDIKFSFEPVLAKQDGKAVPAASALFISESLKEPRLECVIGLKRGAPLVKLTPLEVVNEVMFTVGSYFGLAPSPLTTYVMGKSDLPTGGVQAIGGLESSAVLVNLRAVGELDKAIAEKRRLEPTHPSFFVDPAGFELGSFTQGQKAKFSFQITNRGDAPLAIHASPDCGCVGVEQTKPLKAGASTLIAGQVDTRELIGDFHRRVILSTNDPDHPYRELAINIHVNPLYKVLGMPGKAINLEDGKEFDLLLAVAPVAKFKLTGARMAGIGATVAFEPWTANPGEGEGEFKRGYKFRISITEEGLIGRRWSGLQMTTDDPDFPWITFNFTVQKGIVANPSPLFMGDLKGPRDFALEITRPHRAFKIEKIEVDIPHLTATQPDETSEAIKVSLHYDGRADSGIFKGTIKIFTNDPDQRQVDVPFSASVQ